MRNLSTAYQNRHRLRKNSDKENMSKNVVGLPSSKDPAVNGVKIQTALTFRRLNCQSIVDENEKRTKPDVTNNEDFSFDNNEKRTKPDVTNNEDFSFDKLRGAVEDFEKQQRDRLQKRFITKTKLPDVKEEDKSTHERINCKNELRDIDENEDVSFEKHCAVEDFEKQQRDRLQKRFITETKLPDVKEEDKSTHERINCKNVLRDIDENEDVSFEKHLVQNVSDLETQRSEFDNLTLKVLKEKSSANINNIKNSILAVKSRTLRPRLSPDPCFAPNTTKSYNRECNQNERCNSNPAQSISLQATPKPGRGNFERKARKSRRPMPEGDRITADGDLISLSDECSPRSLSMVCQNEVDSSGIGSTDEIDRGGKRNSSKSYTTPGRHDDNSQPKWKRNRIPNSSENVNIHLTVHRFMDEHDRAVTAINPKVVNLSCKQDSSQLKVRSFNPSRYKVTPKIKKEEVEATDNKNASVQKISQWLGNDPFGNKKQIAVIRQEAKIMTKSKAFEHDDVVQMRKKEVVAEKELQHFPAGKVSQGKKWLQSAFGEEKEEDDCSSVFEKKNKIESAFRHAKH